MAPALKITSSRILQIWNQMPAGFARTACWPGSPKMVFNALKNPCHSSPLLLWLWGDAKALCTVAVFTPKSLLALWKAVYSSIFFSLHVIQFPMSTFICVDSPKASEIIGIFWGFLHSNQIFKPRNISILTTGFSPFPKKNLDLTSGASYLQTPSKGAQEIGNYSVSDSQLLHLCRIKSKSKYKYKCIHHLRNYIFKSIPLCSSHIWLKPMECTNCECPALFFVIIKCINLIHN